jgi:hypothetical protein
VIEEMRDERPREAEVRAEALIEEPVTFLLADGVERRSLPPSVATTASIGPPLATSASRYRSIVDT